MAFFKFRKSGDEPSSATVQPESNEVLRRRAKHRLTGAAVLVLAGVIGFPLLFDKQPRPISVDIPIEIPDRNKVKALSIAEPAAAPKSEEKLTVPVVQAASEAPPASAKADPVAVEKPVEKVIEKPVEKPAPAASRPMTEAGLRPCLKARTLTRRRAQARAGLSFRWVLLRTPHGSVKCA